MGQITNRNQRVCGPVAALLYCILGAAALVAGDAAECILFLHHPKQGPRRPGGDARRAGKRLARVDTDSLLLHGADALRKRWCGAGRR